MNSPFTTTLPGFRERLERERAQLAALFKTGIAFAEAVRDYSLLHVDLRLEEAEFLPTAMIHVNDAEDLFTAEQAVEQMQTAIESLKEMEENL